MLGSGMTRTLLAAIVVAFLVAAQVLSARGERAAKTGIHVAAPLLAMLGTNATTLKVRR
jgi:hypothetical protein